MNCLESGRPDLSIYASAMGEFLGATVCPIYPEAFRPEVGRPNAKALNSATDLFFPLRVAAERRYKDFGVLGVHFVPNIVLVEHHIQVSDGVALFWEFQFTKIEWLRWHRRLPLFHSLRRRRSLVSLCQRQQFLTNFANDDGGNIHTLKLGITFSNPGAAGFLGQIVAGDLLIERDSSHTG